MSSPPNLATSPTFSSGMALTSKKRPLTPIPGPSTSSSKRRKPTHSMSASIGSAHPLRQTSFPPDEANRMLVRSPSVESSVTSSTVLGRGGKGGKRAKDARSTEGGSVRNSVTGRAGTENMSLVDGKSTGAAGEEEDEDDDENDLGTTMMFDGGGQADEDQEKQRLAILVDSFNEDQSDRYDLFRRVKFQPSTLKKVPTPPLTRMRPTR
ncbi:hypothetical protein GP486_003567 [Trichoglossum hirsutum]|uniref:Uncharacterized protein n=1 Tax=Trichoglossum hirsutum TaxID=265104 RepID=A0A9P8LCW0_9PEZI|nr:hypothetical protein GP486_003567 [Trichoglossum hirsutum]